MVRVIISYIMLDKSCIDTYVIDSAIPNRFGDEDQMREEMSGRRLWGCIEDLMLIKNDQKWLILSQDTTTLPAHRPRTLLVSHEKEASEL